MLSDDIVQSDDSAQTGEAAAPTTPPRRRRAASRPAGPPPAVTAPVQNESATAEAVPAESVPAEASSANSGQSDPLPLDVPEASAPAAKKPARRRATRSQAAPPPVEPAAVEPVAAETVVSETAPAETAPAETAPAETAPVEAAPVVTADAEASPSTETEAPETKAPTRRSRSRRASAPAQTPASTTPEQAQSEQVQSEQAQDQPAPSQAADDVSTLLAAAEQQAGGRSRGRRRVAATVANPFLAPETSPDDVLQSLAASIAGRPTAAASDETPDEDEDEGVTDTDLDESGDEDDQATADDSGVGSANDADDDSDDESGDDDSDDDDSDDDTEQGSDSSSSSRRRRRRRGGRRRRRGGDSPTDASSAGADDDDSDDDDSDDDSDDDADGENADHDSDDSHDDDSDSSDSSDAESTSSSRRRRRRRRRRGEDTAGADDDPSEVVVRVREPRRSSRGTSSDEVTGIEGSTRMEAKRQRRREGRAAGRRRAPILSEAEFLARRESVERRMVIRQKDDYTQLAVLEDGVLVEHYVDRKASASMIGNVYLGRVQNVLPSMEAAFIDIGRGRNAVLYAGEVDWEAFGATGDQRKVEQVFKSGQTVLVQVSKDPVGAKGARLTGHIAIPGRYIVYSPGGHLSGISRKLADTERNRLKEILGSLIDEKASVIVRTAAEGASEDELVRDVNRLKAQWDVIEKKVKQGSAPQLLYGEPDLTVRIVRDLFTEDFTELVVHGNGGADDVYDEIDGYVTHVAPHLATRLKKWDPEQGDIFASHRLDEQIAKALERKVFLPSGGSLVIDRTEAMTVIDVNTGRFTGTAGNLEATVTSNNLEAAEEVVRQLRLRDIGGIIVVDFIDMVLPSNRELLIRRLVECLGRDRTRHQVAEVSSLGLVQMTRKKIGTGLAEAFTETCDHCGGRGYHRSEEPVETQAPADGGDRRQPSSHSSGSSSSRSSSGRTNSRSSTSRSRRGRRGDDGSSDSGGGDQQSQNGSGQNGSAQNGSGQNGSGQNGSGQNGSDSSV